MRTISTWSQLGSNNRDNHANAHASAIAAEIAYAGQTLKARLPGSVGETDATWTIVAMPQTPEPGEVRRMLEAGADVNDVAGISFYMDNAQRVVDNMEVVFNGYWYRLGTPYPTMFQGVVLMRCCFGVRGEKVSG